MIILVLGMNVFGKDRSDAVLTMIDDQGLCSIVGSGSEDADSIAFSLAKTGNVIVHRLVLSDAEFQRACASTPRAGLDRYITLEQLSVAPLPYRGNLVRSRLYTYQAVHFCSARWDTFTPPFTMTDVLISDYTMSERQ